MKETDINKWTTLMIERLEEAKGSMWQKGWIGGSGFVALPQNLSGRNYSGTNSLFLLMDTAKNGYTAPVYMTFLQKEKEGLRIKKGAQAMPVIYWDVNIKDADGKKTSISEYNRMSKEEKEKCEVRSFLRSFRVYNIDQTNMQEVNKERYDGIVARFQNPQMADTQGMYKNPALDRMFERQEWLCKIQNNQPASQPYFSPSQDLIVIPQKNQFKIGKTTEDIYKDGMEYYSTALHEMAHSTGTAERLNRNINNHFGDPKYAKEELVAELTSAMVGNTMGFDRRIQDNNAAYIDNWLQTLREEPKFIVSVMADVNKASNMILGKVDEQKMALGEKPVLDSKQEQEKEPSQKQQETHSKNKFPPIDIPDKVEKLGVTAGIYKLPTGNYVVRASIGGQDLEQKSIDNKTAVTYLRLRDAYKMDTMLADIVKAKYGEELRLPREQQQVSRGLKI